MMSEVYDAGVGVAGASMHIVYHVLLIPQTTHYVAHQEEPLSCVTDFLDRSLPVLLFRVQSRLLRIPN